MGYVYLLKANLRSNHAIYKIGMTDRAVHHRLTEIQQEWWNKRRIKVLPVKSISVRDANAVEAHFHRLFKAQRLYGKEMAKMLGGGWCSGDSEWFDGTVEKPALKEFNRYLSPTMFTAQRHKEPEIKPRESFQLTPVTWILTIVFAVMSVFAVVDALSQLILPAPHATTIQRANVRSTPNGKIICVLPAGKSISLSNERDGWYQTNACGKAGVIHRSVVKR